jgi:hypothetical protein
VFTRDDGILEIECDADSEIFDTDEQAVGHVLDEAVNGSLVHVLAVWLDGRRDDPSLWIPPYFLMMIGGV